MKSKEQVFKLIEGRIDTMQALTIECIELIYNAGYNDAIEEAALVVDATNEWGFAIAGKIRELKK